MLVDTSSWSVHGRLQIFTSDLMDVVGSHAGSSENELAYSTSGSRFITFPLEIWTQQLKLTKQYITSVDEKNMLTCLFGWLSHGVPMIYDNLVLILAKPISQMGPSDPGQVFWLLEWARHGRFGTGLSNVRPPPCLQLHCWWMHATSLQFVFRNHEWSTHVYCKTVLYVYIKLLEMNPGEWLWFKILSHFLNRFCILMQWRCTSFIDFKGLGLLECLLVQVYIFLRKIYIIYIYMYIWDI